MKMPMSAKQQSTRCSLAAIVEEAKEVPRRKGFGYVLFSFRLQSHGEDK